MAREGVYRQGLWIYGVLVGLAIREALVHVFPHITANPPDLESWAVRLEVWRLAIFLLMITRFYFGSVLFFEDVYFSAETPVKYDKKSYGLDFLCGFIHFLIFFAWATTIGIHFRLTLGTSYFSLLLGVILLYDLWWLLVCRGYDTVKRMKLWTFINSATFVFCALLFFGGVAFKADAVLLEELVFVPVLIFSLIDFWELVSEKRFFAEWLGNLIEH